MSGSVRKFTCDFGTIDYALLLILLLRNVELRTVNVAAFQYCMVVFDLLRKLASPKNPESHVSDNLLCGRVDTVGRS